MLGGRRPSSAPRSRPRRWWALGCSTYWLLRRGRRGRGRPPRAESCRHRRGPCCSLHPAKRARRATGGEGGPAAEPLRPPRGRRADTRCRRPRSYRWCAARARGARGGRDERRTALRETRKRPLHAGARCARSVEELLRPLPASARARGRGWRRVSGSQLQTKWSKLCTSTQGAGVPARADRPVGGCGAKAERRRLEAAARAAASAHAPHASVAASCSESAIRTFGHHVHVAHGPEQLPTVRSRRDRQGQQRRCP